MHASIKLFFMLELENGCDDVTTVQQGDISLPLQSAVWSPSPRRRLSSRSSRNTQYTFLDVYCLRDSQPSFAPELGHSAVIVKHIGAHRNKTLRLSTADD